MATVGETFAGNFSTSIVSVEFELGDNEAMVSIVQRYKKRVVAACYHERQWKVRLVAGEPANYILKTDMIHFKSAFWMRRIILGDRRDCM